MAPKFSIRPEENGPNFFNNDDCLGKVMAWWFDEKDVVVNVGNHLAIFQLTDENSDLAEVKRVLATA